LAWTDGRSQIPDAWDTAYLVGEIVLSASRDSGSTWSRPMPVSPLPANSTGPGTDQFMPGASVDRAGTVAICYSDRRNDPANNLVDHYCSISSNHGASFTDVRETPHSWIPTHFTDLLVNGIYMGDYDTVSSEATGRHSGFFNTFQVQINSNPDVYGLRLSSGTD
jgi:hypothetical protein